MSLSQFHWSAYLFLYQYYEFFITIALQCSLRLGLMIPIEVLLLFRIALSSLAFYPSKMENFSFKAYKKLCLTFDGVKMNI